ncbi:MAG: thioredoxin-like domain-containing protein [bacterium]
MCLFFSAGWCPPCQTFLPKLVEFYNEINLETKILEIICKKGKGGHLVTVFYFRCQQGQK